MFAASVGEVNACLIRVPVENVKQRRQAESVKYNSSITVMRNIFKLEGVKGFYRGYVTTVMREIPFSLIQFPIWEKLKSVWKNKQSHDIEAWQSAVCGSFAGGISAGNHNLYIITISRLRVKPSNCQKIINDLNYILFDSINMPFRRC